MSASAKNAAIDSTSSLIGKLSRLWKGPELASTRPSANTTSLPSSLLNEAGRWRTMQVTVDKEWDGVRLDRLLTSKYNISSPLAHKLIRLKKVSVEKERASATGPPPELIPARSGLRLSSGDSVCFSSIYLPLRAKRSADKADADGPSRIAAWKVFEDDKLLAINKPSGISCHGASDDGGMGGGSVVSYLNDLNEDYRLVHRLDQDTSGLLLVAKDRRTAELLASGLAPQLDGSAAKIGKTYLAMLAGVPKELQGQIKTMLYRAQGRSRFSGARAVPRDCTLMTTERSKRADLLDEGKAAITDYRVVSVHKAEIGGVRVKLALVEFRPLTGRTHQLRVHAAEQLDCPVVGDMKYGLTKTKNLSRISGIGRGLHLHAQQLILPAHAYENPEQLTLQAPVPDNFAHTLTRFPIYIRPPRPGTKDVISRAGKL